MSESLKEILILSISAAIGGIISEYVNKKINKK
jgi:hypothetical protein